MRIPIRDGLFTTPEDLSCARLLGTRCGDCNRVAFPPQSICPYCSGDRCETISLSAEGVLYLCTTVRTRPPGYVGDVPFGFGIVELPEGIRIVSRIKTPEPALGAAVRLVIEGLHTDADGHQVMSYAFEAVHNR